MVLDGMLELGWVVKSILAVQCRMEMSPMFSYFNKWEVASTVGVSVYSRRNGKNKTVRISVNAIFLVVFIITFLIIC